MRPEHMPALKGKDANRFIKQDKKPLKSEQKQHLKKCLETYTKNPIKQNSISCFMPTNRIDFEKIKLRKLDLSDDLSDFARARNLLSHNSHNRNNNRHTNHTKKQGGYPVLVKISRNSMITHRIRKLRANVEINTQNLRENSLERPQRTLQHGKNLAKNENGKLKQRQTWTRIAAYIAQITNSGAHGFDERQIDEDLNKLEKLINETTTKKNKTKKPGKNYRNPILHDSTKLTRLNETRLPVIPKS